MATDRLNEYERGIIVPLVCDMLTKANARPLPSQVIAEAIRKIGHKVDTRSVRRVISYIRREGLVSCVASSPKGFFVANNVREITDTILSLEGRVDAIQEVIDALREQRYFKFNL